MSDVMLYAGIDVAKAKLDLALRLGPQQFREATFPNSPAGIQRLIRTLTKTGLPCRVVLEPTSRFHVQLAGALAATPGCQVMAVNPRQARQFQQGQGGRAKTDALDARSLAVMAGQLDSAAAFCAFTPPRDELRRLQLLGRQIAVCVATRAKAKCRIASYPTQDPLAAELIASNRRTIQFVQDEINCLLQHMHQIVQADQQLQQIYDLLVGIRGISRQGALQLLGELAVLPPGMGPRQWVACAGLDPQPQQSGQCAKPARISRMGNRYLKQVLYMAAMTTTQFEPQIKAYYERLHARKHSKRLAQVVVMRRLLHGFWHVLHRQIPFAPELCFAIPGP